MSKSTLAKLTVAIALLQTICAAPAGPALKDATAYPSALFHTYADVFEPFAVPEVADSRVVQLTRHDLGDPGDYLAKNALRLREQLGHDAARRRGKRATALDFESVLYGNEYIATVQVGNQSVKVIMDTGSSDTWVVSSNFQCFDYETEVLSPQANCEFGLPYYTPTSTYNASKIPNRFLNVSYADGTSANGAFGFDYVTLGNLTVLQQVGVATDTLWFGDLQTIGLMGLAQPRNTRSYNSSGVRINYNPIMTTMYNTYPDLRQLFSMALARPAARVTNRTQASYGGLMVLGGIPSQTQVNYTGNFTTVPLVSVYANSLPDRYYPVKVDGASIGGSLIANSTSFTAIVDSGSTSNYFPQRIASSINSRFSPPAVYNSRTGVYAVNCTAVAPAVSMIIGGQPFTINPADILLRSGTSNVCRSGIIGSSESDIFVLGDVFMRNVVAVFNLGNSSMSFAQID